MANWWSSFFDPAQGAQNSAQMRVAARPSDVPAYVATPDTSTQNAPDTMTDADRAYWAGNTAADQQAGNAISSFFAPAPGAKNSAYKNLPQGPILAGMTGQTPEDLIAGYTGGGTDAGAAPSGQQPPLLQALQAGAAPSADQSGAAAAADNSPAGAGGGGIANLPTNLNVASGTPDVTADQTDPVAQGAAMGPGLLANIMGQAQQSASDPNASKGFLGKLADSFSDIGDKLTNLSPAASQGFLMAGLNMLANNSGGKNLSQLVGGAGQAGIEQYQAVKQQQIANQMAAAKQNWEMQKEAADLQIRANTPSGLQPGEAYNTPARIAAGLGPVAPAIPKIVMAAQKNQDGTTQMVPTNAFTGEILGKGYMSDASIPEPQQKRMEDASTAQATATDALNRTNGFIKQLMPYQTDNQGNVLKDANGQPIKNTNQVQPPGGLWGHIEDLATKLTGWQDPDQAFAQQIMRNLRGDAISAFRNTGANRITQGEFSTLNKGLPENPDAQTLQNYLQLVAKVQQVSATRAQLNAEFTNANRGVPGPLNQNSVIMGHMYPKGATVNDIFSGTTKALDGTVIGMPDPEAGQQQGAAPAAPAAAPAAPAPVPAAPTNRSQLVAAARAELRRRQGQSG